MVHNGGNTITKPDHRHGIEARTLVSARIRVLVFSILALLLVVALLQMAFPVTEKSPTPPEQQRQITQAKTPQEQATLQKVHEKAPADITANTALETITLPAPPPLPESTPAVEALQSWVDTRQANAQKTSTITALKPATQQSQKPTETAPLQKTGAEPKPKPFAITPLKAGEKQPTLKELLNAAKKPEKTVPPSRLKPVSEVLERQRLFEKLAANPVTKTADAENEIAKHQPEPNPEAIKVSREDIQKGRVLLKSAEHGKGPEITFGWPQKGAETVFRQLSCAGMVPALLDREGRLWRLDERPGEHWAVNRDHYSTIMRQVRGRVSGESEAGIFRVIARKHRLEHTTTTRVRIFPRRLDATLMGGLHQLIGNSYTSSRQIKALYTPGQVQEISRDGIPVKGSITLPSHCR